MKAKKVWSGFLVITLMLTLSNGTVNAAGSQTTNEEDLSPKMEYYEMKEEELPDISDEKVANQMERQYEGEKYTITGDVGVAAYAGKRASSENTDPNNAYIVENGMEVQGTVATEGEARWYAFNVNERNKVTILAQMVETMDADLYVFSLNQETYELELLGGSATAGAGIEEYVNGILDPGIYFFAIQGYEGTGNFAFAFYQNTNIDNEPNESIETASTATLGSAVTGKIDNPYDVDFYKMELTSAVQMSYSLSTSENYKMEVGTYNGRIINISATGTYKFFPGTYYFRVSSRDMSYSPTQAYTINTRKLRDMVSDSRTNYVGICEKANIYYETDFKTVHYVNGHIIDPSYSYKNYLSNSAGSQSYDMTIDKSKVQNVVKDGMNKPDVLYYISSTRPAMNVGSKHVLSLTFTGDNLYNIYNICSGAYSMNSLSRSINAVNVLIDPATGKLIDILEFNYYYDFAPVGSNEILVTNPGWGLDFN